jgi:hypothetical protein
MGPIRITVRDQDGNEVPSEPIRPDYHPALRFYRLSQVTDDLYDSYRNMYLAFEMLISSRFQKGNEQELKWL